VSTFDRSGRRVPNSIMMVCCFLRLQIQREQNQETVCTAHEKSQDVTEDVQDVTEDVQHVTQQNVTEQTTSSTHAYMRTHTCVPDGGDKYAHIQRGQSKYAQTEGGNKPGTVEKKTPAICTLYSEVDWTLCRGFQKKKKFGCLWVQFCQNLKSVHLAQKVLRA